jgi:hypothetical protein
LANRFRSDDDLKAPLLGSLLLALVIRNYAEFDFIKRPRVLLMPVEGQVAGLGLPVAGLCDFITISAKIIRHFILERCSIRHRSPK